MVIVRSIPIFFEIGLVMLVVVADQILQGEPVVGSHKIDTGSRMAAVPLVEIAASREPIPEFRQLPRVALPIAAHNVAVPSVPFRPQSRESANLIAAFPNIP